MPSLTGSAYRDQWLRGIEKFEAVYRMDPDGPWAAAGLYMSAQLYLELYRHSQRPSDRQEACDIYQRIVNRFPHSRYQPKARQALVTLGQTGATAPKPKPAAVPGDAQNKAKTKYLAAEACYRKLQKSAAKQKYRQNWLDCIRKYQAVYSLDPEGPWAAAGLYKSARCYLELYQHSFRTADRQTAIDIFNTIVTQYPRSRYHPKSLSDLKTLGKTKKSPKVQKTSAPETRTAPADEIARVIDTATAGTASGSQTVSAKNGSARITGLRHWSNPNYTRVVIDADHTVEFSHRLLKKDTRINKPQRLYVDLIRCRLAQGVQKTVPINDNLLSDARAGQHTGDTVRVVVDIKDFKTYKIFSLRNPFRIVIDVWGAAGQSQTAAQASETPSDGGTGKVGPSAIARQFALGVSRIVVDPGHGGHDPGAKGYLKGIQEKNVVLLSLAAAWPKKFGT